MEMRSPQKIQLGKIMRALSGGLLQVWPPHLTSLILCWRDDAGLALSSSVSPFPPGCVAEHLLFADVSVGGCGDTAVPASDTGKQVFQVDLCPGLQQMKAAPCIAYEWEHSALSLPARLWAVSGAISQSPFRETGIQAYLKMSHII